MQVRLISCFYTPEVGLCDRTILDYEGTECVNELPKQEDGSTGYPTLLHTDLKSLHTESVILDEFFGSVKMKNVIIEPCEQSIFLLIAMNLQQDATWSHTAEETP